MLFLAVMGRRCFSDFSPAAGSVGRSEGCPGLSGGGLPPMGLGSGRPAPAALAPGSGHLASAAPAPAPGRRLSSCDARAQLLWGLWNLPGLGLELVSPAPAVGGGGNSLKLSHQGSLPNPFLITFWVLF